MTSRQLLSRAASTSAIAITFAWGMSTNATAGMSARRASQIFCALMMASALAQGSGSVESKCLESISPVEAPACPDTHAKRSLSACNDQTKVGKAPIGVKSLAGLYRRSVAESPAQVGRPEERLHGFDYLAITPLSEKRLRVRLSTKEINGHDCGFDSEALLCGPVILLMPNDDERNQLEARELPVPRLFVTKKQIAFMPSSDGTYVWGSPYCGAMGYLRHSFQRITRRTNFDDRIFDR